MKPQHLAQGLTLLAGGVLFVFVFGLRYSLIDEHLYQFRDDGVITMSVGRNIVDYGFIGVNPSGPIVEASSSPLQTLLYALAYLITGLDYAQFSWGQTYVTAFVIGVIYTAFFLPSPLISIAISGLSAVGLSFFYPFFLWNGSGMENPFTHALYLLTVFLLYKAVRDDTINYLFAVPIFLATIVRIESALYISILLTFFSVYWWYYKRTLQGLCLSSIVGALWIIFQAGRIIYFGDILPNTAYAQDISLKHRLISLATLDGEYIYKTSMLTIDMCIKQGWWIALMFLPVYFLTAPKNSNSFLLLSVFVLFCSITASPFFFGPARIDITRTTTHTTLLLMLAVFFSIFNTSDSRKCAVSLVVLLPLSVFAYLASDLQPYYLGWSTKEFDEVRVKFLEIAEENVITRPTVSNPDLGVLTWHKQFNVVDLGMLGSPEIAKIKNRPILRKYFLEYALPDIIESHTDWTQRYCGSLLHTEEFQHQYEMIDADDDIMSLCHSDRPARRFWIRRDIKLSSQSHERRFLDALQNDLDVDLIRREVYDCNTSRASCAYIARTVYKFIPELRRKGLIEEVVQLFDQKIDRSFLTGWNNARAHIQILKEIGYESD